MGDKLETQVLGAVSGTHGHDPLLCRLLATRISVIAARHQVSLAAFRWILNGDQSRVGTGSEFDVVRDFVETVPARDAHGRSLRPTLGLARKQYVDVPGNHDHFDGWDPVSKIDALRHPPPAWNPAIFPASFRQTAWAENPPWLSSEGSISLELFGVDSNSGLAGQSANRYASGEISDAEFALLEDELRRSNEKPPPDGVKPVRAIICHHALTKKPQDSFWKASPLSPDSVRRLKELAATYRVVAILTGHTHKVCFRKLDVMATPLGERQRRRCTVYELRSPTTLQGPSSAVLNGFWVHHLFRSADAKVIWRPRLYMLAAQQFQPQNVKDCEDLLLP
jgi:hypothetical protein